MSICLGFDGSSARVVWQFQRRAQSGDGEQRLHNKWSPARATLVNMLNVFILEYHEASSNVFGLGYYRFVPLQSF